MNKVELRARVLLTFQVALLGAIDARIRAVACCWTDSQIAARVIFDGPVTASDWEGMSEVETEVMPHFPDFQVNVECVRVDAPEPIHLSPNDFLVFKRREA